MSIPRRIRDRANRRQHVKFDAWPGDVYYIPMPDVNYVVGVDGVSLTRSDVWGNDSEIDRRLSMTTMEISK